MLMDHKSVSSTQCLFFLIYFFSIAYLAYPNIKISQILLFFYFCAAADLEKNNKQRAAAF